MATRVVYPPARSIPLQYQNRAITCFLIYGEEMDELMFWAKLSCFLVGLPFLLASVVMIVRRIRSSSTIVT